jgi:hypothetical protein
MIERETMPCMFCGQSTPYLGTKKCDNCWEVDGRIDDFAKTPAGQRRLLEAHPFLMGLVKAAWQAECAYFVAPRYEGRLREKMTKLVEAKQALDPNYEWIDKLEPR